MEDVYDYTGFAIENILHPKIEAIEQGTDEPEEKQKRIKDAFKVFLEEAQKFDECDRLKKMTVEQLQKEYEKLMEKQIEEER